MPDLTEERIREIVREEIRASIMRGAIRLPYVAMVSGTSEGKRTLHPMPFDSQSSRG